MTAEHVSVRIDDVTLARQCLRANSFHCSRVVAVRDETNLLTLGLVRGLESDSPRVSERTSDFTIFPSGNSTEDNCSCFSSNKK